MLRGAVGSRYAEALYSIAEANGTVDKVEEEIKAISELVNANKELQKILYHPRITAQDKKDLLKSILDGKVSDITANFLYLLVDRQREAFLGDIVEFFTDLANKARNIAQAEVSSAVELSKDEKKKLAEVLGKITGKKVQTIYSVDASLIGGVVIRIGDKVIDGSVRTRLANLREHLRQIS